VEAGADAALTQLFYNADVYFDFMERCEKAGIKIPVVPGIMPITSYANTMRFCSGCGADLPRWVRLRLEELEDDKPALHEFGLSVVTRLCETLLRGGARAALLHHQSGRADAAACGRIYALAYPLKRD
jgi:methylenetetrahydrofolate reductase (NADPH)